MSDILQRRSEIKTRFHYFRTVIIISVALVMSANALLYWKLSNPPRAPLPASVIVQEMHASGDTDLCPNRTLDYAYTLAAREPAVVDISTATLQLTPDAKTYNSGTQRESFPEPMTVKHMEQWLVPEHAPPGDYVRIVAIASPGRYAVSFGTLPFTVDECKEN